MEIKEKSFAKVYEKLLYNLMNNAEYESAPRGQQTKEITDITLEVEDPSLCIYENERRSSQNEYIAAELIWYFKGDRSVNYIKRYAKFWESIATVNPEKKFNPIKDVSSNKYERIEYIENNRLDNLCHNSKNLVVNSAYGDLIFTKRNEHGYSQYQWAFESLAKDKDSRQAIMHFNTPIQQYEGNMDFVCTLSGMFMIRNNKLNLTISMRSNDAILGLPTDIPFFCTLQRHMLYHLKPLYPDLELGSYKHKVHSMHIYEKHFKLIEDMLKKEFIVKSLPDIDKPFVNTFGDPTDITNNLFEWANDDIREPIIGMSNDEFVDFLTNNLITHE